jgi:DNA replication initiation complex subunit (GINS family)
MYDELYQAWKAEKENQQEVQPLPKDFFTRLAEYFRRLKEESRMLDDKTVRARLLLEESKNVKMLGEELIRLRYEKALEKAKAGEPLSTEGLTLEEERLFKEVGGSAEAFASFLRDVLSGKSSDVKTSNAEATLKEDIKDSLGKGETAVVGGRRSVLRFVQSVPGIIGADMKPYGPFKPEDVASVPVENAKVLVKQGLAVEVEVKA